MSRLKSSVKNLSTRFCDAHNSSDMLLLYLFNFMKQLSIILESSVILFCFSINSTGTRFSIESRIFFKTNMNKVLNSYSSEV